MLFRSVGGLLGEDVAHVGAGVDLQAAPALPDLGRRQGRSVSVCDMCSYDLFTFYENVDN